MAQVFLKCDKCDDKAAWMASYDIYTSRYFCERHKPKDPYAYYRRLGDDPSLGKENRSGPLLERKDG